MEFRIGCCTVKTKSRVFSAIAVESKHLTLILLHVSFSVKKGGESGLFERARKQPETGK